MSLQNESLYRGRFIHKYNRLFYDAFRISRYDPAQGAFWLRTFLRQKRLGARRRSAESDGLVVPPVLIFSVTSRCNLRCKGCYAIQHPDQVHDELSAERIRTLFTEASQLGTGVILIAGGEPLMRPEILDAAGQQKDIIFPVFTNGMLFNDDNISCFMNHRNLIPVLSMEGNRRYTDTRRGEGVHRMFMGNMGRFSKRRKMFGISITLTQENFDEVTHPVWLHEHHSLGCNLFFLVEYVPRSKLDMALCLTDSQKEVLPARMETLRKQIPALMISLPGEEEKYGGCLAAGRGFIHINAQGSLEPCPFAPYSDISIREMSLKEALHSPFIRKIRHSHQMLTEANGGCTLWENREWVEAQLESVVARPA
jgi:MoaA/NifB/PqqE/SkfB family radical SAM enzyme